MADEDNFLSRWSRRKIEAREGSAREPQPPAAESAPAPPAVANAPAAGAAPAEPAPLPPLESLTPESDFSPFMGKEVDAGTRSKALKALFADPRFNTMDMMDVYVDDYSKPDPLPAGWLGKLQQLSHLGDKAGRDREDEERRAREEAGPGPALAPEAAAAPEKAAGDAPEGHRGPGEEGAPPAGEIPPITLGESDP